MSISVLSTRWSPPSPRNTSEKIDAPSRITNTIELMSVVPRTAPNIVVVTSRRSSGTPMHQTKPIATEMTSAVSRPIAPIAQPSATSRPINPIQNQKSLRSSASASICRPRRSLIALLKVSMIAPSDPTEADSVGVATPATIEPSTAMISRIGGISAMTMRRPSPFFSASVIPSGGQDFGSTMALKMTQTM